SAPISTKLFSSSKALILCLASLVEVVLILLTSIYDFNKNYTIHGGFLATNAKNPHTLKV
ncbi:MAG: hypothetical protein J6C06_04990, partial [Lachnospiraceae bacterium]|nr:hypothetical protein [Lachnospiraceae bacterium]